MQAATAIGHFLSIAECTGEFLGVPYQDLIKTEQTKGNILAALKEEWLTSYGLDGEFGIAILEPSGKCVDALESLVNEAKERRCQKA